MSANDRCINTSTANWLAVVLVVIWILSAAPAARGDDPTGPAMTKSAGARSAEKPLEVEAHFADGSTLRVAVHDARIDVQTRYGTVRIPVAEVRRIELATRVEESVAKRIDEHLAKLSSPDFGTREVASSALIEFHDRAIPALLKATKHPNLEVVHRAEQILGKLRETLPADRFEIRKDDVIHTDDMKIAGTIAASSLRVTTRQFGEQQIKLADLRSVRSMDDIEPENIQPDPGRLYNLRGQLGKVFFFRVTGATEGSLWGTDTYTLDSSLAVAAVHSGAVRPGQTGVVKVTILGAQPAFQGSNRNGVTSQDYGHYDGSFRVRRVRED